MTDRRATFVTGSVIAGILGVIGIYGWSYFLASVIQGGLATGVAVPFQVFGIAGWVIFWGGALGTIAAFFGAKSRTMRFLLITTGIMLAIAILTAILAA